MLHIPNGAGLWIKHTKKDPFGQGSFISIDLGNEIRENYCERR